MRSKRFMTLRLPPKVDAARRLGCCDINLFQLKLARFDKKRTGTVAAQMTSANGYFGMPECGGRNSSKAQSFRPSGWQ